VLRTASVGLAYSLPGQPLSECYAFSGMVFYVCCLVVILRSVGVSLRAVLKAATQAAPIWLGWTALGFFFLGLLEMLVL
jgi:hypothetical protein